MKELIIDVWGKFKTKPIVTIDGQRVEYERRDGGAYRIYHTSDKDKVTVRVIKILEINCKNWFLWHLLYFFISVFGLFDIRSDRKCIVYDLSFEAELIRQKTTLSVRILRPKKKGVAADIKGDTNIAVKENSFRVDKAARRKVLIFGLLKLVALAAIVALAICLIIGVITI